MRKLIRNLMNKVGYDIVKVNVHSERKASKVSRVRVGNYFVDMPGNNPQISNYKYEPLVNSQLGRLAKCIAGKYPDLTVIDIGANVGDTIAVIKSQVDVPVIGVEGDEVSYRFLEKNTKQFKDITIIREFLGEKKETLKIALEKGGWNTTLVPDEAAGKDVTLRTLDEVLESEKLHLRRLKLLKVDCEGFDTIIIRGAVNLLQQQQPVVYFEYNKSNMEAIHEDGLSTLLSLAKYGYRTVILFDNKGRFIAEVPMQQRDLLYQLHHYADEKDSEIAYYDVCLFHESDKDLQQVFMQGEAPYLQ
jgi:FkbM family methyltransferase